MKSTLLFATLTLFLFASCKKEDQTDSPDTGKTQLHSIEQTLYGYSYGKISTVGRDWDYKEFDPSGNLVKETKHSSLDYNSNINIGRTTTYKYEKSNLVEYSDWNWRYVLIYENGNLSTKEVYGSTGLSRKFTYEYRNGVLNLEREYFINMEVPTRNMTYEYANGNVSKIYIDSSSGDAQLLYTYDDHGNLLTETYYVPSTGRKTVQIENFYQYDSLNRVSTKVFKESMTKYKATYKYEGDSDKILEVMYEKNLSGDQYENWANVKYTYTYK